MNFAKFLTLNFWSDATALLNCQIDEKKNNRTYNTLNFHYFDSIRNKVRSVHNKKYFNDRVATSLFYALDKEFFFEKYMTSKKGIGLRNFCFFSYPMMTLYYSVGLYLMRLTQQFIQDSSVTNIHSFYGAGIFYEGDKLIFDEQKIYYRQYYIKFDKIRKSFNNRKKKNRVVTHLDIQNYYDNVSIEILLELITANVKPSELQKSNFDSSTRDLISFFFQNLNSGVLPQGSINIISGFLGYFYLIFGDNIIRDIINSEEFRDYIDKFEIARYVDDIYLSIDFHKSFEDIELQRQFEDQVLFRILHRISDGFHAKLRLRFNAKTKIWHPHILKESKSLNKQLNKPPSTVIELFDISDLFTTNKKETDEKKSTQKDKPNLTRNFNAQELLRVSKSLPSLKETRVKKAKSNGRDFLNKKLDNYFLDLQKLKELSPIDIIDVDGNISIENLRAIYDLRISNLLNTKEHKKRLKDVFKNFDYSLIKYDIKAVMASLLRVPEAKNDVERYLMSIQNFTSYEFDLAVMYLNMTDFDNKKLFKRISENNTYSHIVNHFLNKTPISPRKCGYFGVKTTSLIKLKSEPSLLEQIRLRKYAEKRNHYSLALNHLLNEVHFLICLKAKGKMKDFDANRSIDFLKSINTSNELVAKTRNLFDRRNNNAISHPGDEYHIAWGVEQSEYEDYKLAMSKLVNFII